MKYVIVFDPDRCSACSACAVACMDQNDIDIQAGERGYRRAFEWESQVGGQALCAYISASCLHCGDAPCIMACPTGCLRRSLTTGLVIYDNSGCIGCRSCSLACPFGAPRFRADGKMVKCDGCHVRLENGLKPACVRACAFDALICLTGGEYQKMLEEKAESSLVKALGVWGPRG
jgi:anaerobic dimethyl sulfoxide reductase subunit B (iron-sulfur subunit)